MLGYIKKEKENDENKRKKNWETVGKKKFRHDWEEIKQKMRKGNEREKKNYCGGAHQFVSMFIWLNERDNSYFSFRKWKINFIDYLWKRNFKYTQKLQNSFCFMKIYETHS